MICLNFLKIFIVSSGMYKDIHVYLTSRYVLQIRVDNYYVKPAELIRLQNERTPHSLYKKGG